MHGMRPTEHWGLCSTWHHRVLGALWAVCGGVVVVKLFRLGSWSQYQEWIALIVAGSFVTTGIGFTLGRGWARRTMVALAVVAALFFADMLLMSGWHGNRSGMWVFLFAIGVCGYTIFFVAISAAWHSHGSSP